MSSRRRRGLQVVDVVVVFFFQAEDGIRDYKVTGVQTCALPICRGGEAEQMGHLLSRLLVVGELLGKDRAGEIVNETLGANLHSLNATDLGLQLRSEERRVGKECRSRWSPYH